MPYCFEEFCPCGWKLGSTTPHRHAKRMRKFWEGRLQRNPPKRFKQHKDRPSRLQRELREKQSA